MTELNRVLEDAVAIAKRHSQRSLRPDQAVAFVPFNPKMCFSGLWTTVGEEIEVLSQIHASDAGRVIAEFGIQELLAKQVHELSGGESVLCAFAYSACSKPAVWVVQDCLDWLDASQHTRILRFLEAERERGGSVFLIEAGGGAERSETIVQPIIDQHTERSRAANKGGDILTLREFRVHVSDSFEVGPIELCVRAGACVALTGPNGSGKSSLAKGIAGIAPTSGLLRVANPTLPDEKPSHTNVIYSFQNPDEQLYLPTVRAEIGEASRRFSARSGDRISDILQIMELNEFLEDDPLKLLLAERRMVTIASALCTDVPLIILDEPSAFITLGQRERVMKAVEYVTSAGGAVIVISHDYQLVGGLGAEQIEVVRDGGFSRIRHKLGRYGH